MLIKVTKQKNDFAPLSSVHGKYLKTFPLVNITKSMVFISGWIEDFYSESTETIVEAYIKRRDHNISKLLNRSNAEQQKKSQLFFHFTLSYYRLGPIFIQ